jgi:hypothetical protein
MDFSKNQTTVTNIEGVVISRQTTVTTVNAVVTVVCLETSVVTVVCLALPISHWKKDILLDPDFHANTVLPFQACIYFIRN